ncbi:ABC transporter permease subunit [Amycolatopsis magusensis]|uniref:ABC transporter permease subunit n=1 Tax=Amycolatopsis magusensis TaxID=882444 RepID=UPI0024A8B853|nr:ABC transporter permease subunit [Amycolatopsis magusensis]MDI5974757.1 ABC transporter permease subunit [Amycolatopsis magusensis]
MTAIAALPHSTPARAVGVPRLLRAELRWIFRRPRTLAVLGLLAAMPAVIGIGLTFVDGPPSGGSGGPDNGGDSLLVAAAGNALVLPIAALTMGLGLLLPLAAAMASADALAGESSHGTLRGWLLSPVSRGRLLAVKALGVGVVVLVAVTAMAVVGVVTGVILNGTDAIFTLSGTTPGFGAVLGKIAIAVLWVTLQAWAIGAVALAISACTEHPMLVVASVLGGVIVSSVLQLLDSLSWLHPFLLNSSWEALADVLRDPVPTASLLEGAIRAACYIAIGLSLAYARIITKDG